MTQPRQPRAAIYVRVSTSSQEDGTSLETQEAESRAYAAQHGYQVAALHREVHTGTELWERPQLTALREAVRRREVDVVIAHAIDRLARDPVHLGVIVSEAQHAGVDVQVVTEPLDDSPEGQLIRFVRGYAAKVEHEKIKERSQRGRLARAQAGKPLVGCRPPFGYQWVYEIRMRAGREISVPVRLEPDPVTTPVVQRIFADAIGGKPLRAIAAALNTEGVPTPTQVGQWNHSSVRYILTHPVYAGAAAALRYRKTRRASGKKGWAYRSEDETIALPAVAPPLVDGDTFAAIGARLRQNQLEAPRNNHFPEDTLLRGGYARCGYCGGALTTQRHSQTRHWRYVCDRSRERGSCRGVSIKAEVLDTAALAKIEESLTPERIAAKLREHAADTTSSEADLAAVQRSLDTLERRAANLTRRLALLEDEDAAALVARELEALAAQRRQLLAERDAVLARRSQYEAAQANFRSLVEWCEKVRSRLKEMSHSAKRDALFALDLKAVVYRKGHAPRYHITTDLSFEEDIADRTGAGPQPRSPP